VTAEFLVELLQKQGGVCQCTGRRLTFTRGQGNVLTNASLDRIDPNKHYSQDNIRITTWAFNMLRNVMTDDELLDHCRSIIDNLGRHKDHASQE